MMKLVLALIALIVVLSVVLFKLLKQEKIKTNKNVSRPHREWRTRKPACSANNKRAAPVFRSSSEDVVMPINEQENGVIDHSSDSRVDETSDHPPSDADSILGLKTQTHSSEPPSSSEPPPQPDVSVSSVTQPPPSIVPAPIITMHLKAAGDRPYAGYELLQALLSNGLRFGGRQIFHYYQAQQVDQDIVFSCASMVKPGTFDLAKMGGFSTPGLVFFLETQYADNPRKAFELLLNTIDGMVEDLGGTVFDERLQPFCTETLMKIYRQIDQYVESRHTHDLFATAPL